MNFLEWFTKNEDILCGLKLSEACQEAWNSGVDSERLSSKLTTTLQSTANAQICPECGGEYSVGICKTCGHRKGM